MPFDSGMLNCYIRVNFTAGGLVNNQRKFSSLVILILFLLLYVSVSFAAPTVSCVTCHTNESLMKALHKPPPMPASEGEG
jgi:hypothetical protein